MLCSLAVSVACDSGPYCAGFCPDTSSPIVAVENSVVASVAIVSASSSCGNAVMSSTGVSGSLLDSAATCHFEVVLSNGDTESFEVPFTDHQKFCCCGSCQEGYVAQWTTVTISLALDASPFPSVDASSDAAVE